MFVCVGAVGLSIIPNFVFISSCVGSLIVINLFKLSNVKWNPLNNQNNGGSRSSIHGQIFMWVGMLGNCDKIGAN